IRIISGVKIVNSILELTKFIFILFLLIAYVSKLFVFIIKPLHLSVFAFNFITKKTTQLLKAE
ncbi:hypothetical protein DKZ25_11675, partial [Limosilactobacillus reuteri]